MVHFSILGTEPSLFSGTLVQVFGPITGELCQWGRRKGR